MLKRAAQIIAEALRVPAQTGQATVMLMEHVFTEQMEIGDIVEIAGLPAYSSLVDITVDGETITGSHTLALLDGTAGDQDDTRAAETTLATVNVANETRLRTRDLRGIAKVDYDRGIGLVLTAQITANAANKLFVTVKYIQ